MVKERATAEIVAEDFEASESPLVEPADIAARPTMDVRVWNTLFHHPEGLEDVPERQL